MRDKDLRHAIVEACRKLEPLGLNRGAAGNISVRFGDHLLITPSGVPYDLLRPEMIAEMPILGEYGAWRGRLKPSSEWRFHLDVLRARTDVGAVVHTHALYATALSMLRKPILASHYMIAAFGGPDVRCAPYATFGTKELSDNALEALQDRHAALLANHGAIACGGDLDEAMWRMAELERLAQLHHLALAAGKPAILSDEEVFRVIERFKTYGYKNTPPPGPATQAENEDTFSKAAKAKAAKTKAAKAKTAKAKAEKAKAEKVKAEKVKIAKAKAAKAKIGKTDKTGKTAKSASAKPAKAKVVQRQSLVSGPSADVDPTT